MLKVGDKVYVEDAADIDCTEKAWEYIKDHRVATVLAVRPGRKPYITHMELALDFGEVFDGGHYCSSLCDSRRGQFVMANNVSLMFEASREVVTVPNPGPDTKAIAAYQKRLDEGKPSIQRC